MSVNGFLTLNSRACQTEHEQLRIAAAGDLQPLLKHGREHPKCLAAGVLGCSEASTSQPARKQTWAAFEAAMQTAMQLR